MSRTRIFVVSIIAALFLTGSSCSKDDTSLVVDFINSWMQSRGILDEHGNPTVGTVRYVASGGWVSSGDKDNDAIIDAGQVVKSVKDADEMVDKANVALDKNPPDRATALTNLTNAVDKRPNDWYIRSHKGVLLLDMGQSTTAAQYLSSNDSACDPNKNAGLSRAQAQHCFTKIQHEANLLADANVRANRAGEKPSCAVLRQQSSSNWMLSVLASEIGNGSMSDTFRQTSESASRNQNCR